MLFIIIGQARGLKEQSASEGGQGKKAFKNYIVQKKFSNKLEAMFTFYSGLITPFIHILNHNLYLK